MGVRLSVASAKLGNGAAGSGDPDIDVVARQGYLHVRTTRRMRTVSSRPITGMRDPSDCRRGHADQTIRAAHPIAVPVIEYHPVDQKLTWPTNRAKRTSRAVT